jgi:hypothetical protein
LKKVVVASPTYITVNDIIGCRQITFKVITGTFYALKWLNKDIIVYGDGDFAIKTFEWKTENTTTIIPAAHTNDIRFLEFLGSTAMMAQRQARTCSLKSGT